MIEEDDETLPYAEEDWQDPEQREVPKNLELDLPFTIQTRQNDRARSKKKYNPYGDVFVVDRIDLKKTAVIRTRLDESACLGMAERNDVGPKGDQCHDSRCRS